VLSVSSSELAPPGLNGGEPLRPQFADAGRLAVVTWEVVDGVAA
jgi:hypothetical protein